MKFRLIRRMDNFVKSNDYLCKSQCGLILQITSANYVMCFILVTSHTSCIMLEMML